MLTLSTKKTFILVHGAWHASWCWRHIVPLLKAQGHEVLTFDLPGRGQQSILTGIQLATHVDALLQLINTCHQPVTLVGHSMAGIVISQAAEYCPHLIDTLIYIAAFLPRNNDSLVKLASQFTQPGLSTEIKIDQTNNAISLAASPQIKALLFNQCKTEDISFALSQLQNEPMQPFFDKVRLSAKKFGSVKKWYVECIHDLSISLTDQRRMHQTTDCTVVALDADHSPYFSNPTGLAAILATK